METWPRRRPPDTTQFANGAHIIGWLVTDSTGKADGIGSRFFTIANSTMTTGETLRSVVLGDVEALPSAGSRVTGRRGFDRDVPFDGLAAAPDGRPVLHAEELDRLEIRPDEGTTDRYNEGYLRVGGLLRALPIGSNLSGSTFTWQTGPGFLGSHA